MIQNYVSLRASDHRYFDTDMREYMSVSKFLSHFDEKFDAKKWAKLSAGKGKYEGLSADEVEVLWRDGGKDATDHGTRIHGALEEYSKTASIDPSNKDLEPMVKSIISQYKDYHTSYDEVCVYYPFEAPVDGYWGIAGTMDKALIVSSRSKYFDVEDYKTNIKNGIVYNNKYNKYLFAPVSHLQSCNYNKYSLQIGMYGLMYEGLTGFKMRAGAIRYIPAEDPLLHTRIAVPYLKTDCQNMIKHFQNTPIELKVSANVDAVETPNF